MHSYLRAIGFSKLEQKDLDQILQEVIVSCDEKKIAEQGKNDKRNRAGGGNGFGKNIVPVSRGLPGLF